MSIEFSKNDIYWFHELLAVASWAVVDGKVVRFALEGRVIAEYFGVKNESSEIQKAYVQNRSFLEEIVKDTIRRGTFNKWGEVLLGKEELTPYFEQRSATSPA